MQRDVTVLLPCGKFSPPPHTHGGRAVTHHSFQPHKEKKKGRPVALRPSRMAAYCANATWWGDWGALQLSSCPHPHPHPPHPSSSNAHTNVHPHIHHRRTHTPTFTEHSVVHPQHKRQRQTAGLAGRKHTKDTGQGRPPHKAATGRAPSCAQPDLDVINVLRCVPGRVPGLVALGSGPAKDSHIINKAGVMTSAKQRHGKRSYRPKTAVLTARACKR